jgi:CheY-like chemotaxis protein
MTPQERKTILIVDDELDAREALGEFLKRNGYVVAFAGNGQAALDRISTLQAPLALILLDLMMPVMDGYTFLNRAREDDRTKDVPIIVTTGLPSRSAPGATTVLTKPIKPDQLLPLVRRFVH